MARFRWDPEDHPRDQFGRFISAGGQRYKGGRRGGGGAPRIYRSTTQAFKRYRGQPDVAQRLNHPRMALPKNKVWQQTFGNDLGSNRYRDPSKELIQTTEAFLKGTLARSKKNSGRFLTGSNIARATAAAAIQGVSIAATVSASRRNGALARQGVNVQFNPSMAVRLASQGLRVTAGGKVSRQIAVRRR